MSILYVCLYSCPANRFICTIFLDSIVKSLSRVQLCDSMDCSLSASTVHEILQARILEWVFPSPGIFQTQGSNPGLLHCRQMLYHLSYQGSPRFYIYVLICNICFSLSDLLHSVWQTLRPPTSVVVAQSLSLVWLFAAPWIAACQAFLSFTISRSLLKLMSIELIMPSNHLILCRLLLLLPSVFPSIRVFSSESTLRIRWPKYGSFSFSISLSIEYSGLISFRIDWWAIIFELRQCVENPHSDWRASAGAGIEPLILSTSSSAQGANGIECEAARMR